MNERAQLVRHHGVQLAKAVLNHDGTRRAIVRSYLFEVLGRIVPGVAAETDGVWYFVPTADPVGKGTFVHGGFEQEIMAQAVEIASRARSLNGRTFIDVGANIGISSIPAVLEYGAAEAIAVEPSLHNFRLLRCNVIANDLESRIRTVHAALSDHSGTGTLELSESNSGDHRVRLGAPQPGLFEEDSRRTVAVPVMTFDDLLKEVGTAIEDVGLVWMDTQGHEAHVLEGAQALLESDVPIVVEYWPYGLQRAGALERFHQIVARHYECVVDVRRSKEFRAVHVAELAAIYTHGAYTDLVLTNRR